MPIHHLRKKLSGTVVAATILAISAAPVQAQTTKIEYSGSLTADKDGKLSLPPSELRKLKATVAAQRPRVGRDVVGALQSDKRYSTILSIVDRAGLMPLLRGTVKDSTPLEVAFSEDSTQAPAMGSANMQIQGELPPGMSATDLKEQIMDVMNGVVNASLVQDDQITVFAPTNDAFAKLPKASLDSLTGDSAAAAAFVRAHVVNKGIYGIAMPRLRSVQTLAGSSVAFAKTTSGALSVGGAAIVQSDLNADNGVVHGIGTARLAPAAARNP